MAGKDEREPRNPPSGVRATPTIHTSVHAKPRCELMETSNMRLLDFISCQSYNFPNAKNAQGNYFLKQNTV